MDTMQAWFGLKGQHRDFSIQTDEDAGLFFARHEIDEDLKRRLRRAFRTSNPPKMVLYGWWGTGKTHTLRHVQYEIEHQPEYKAVVVFVELPDINKKSTFQVAHAALLDALGNERVKTWLLQFQAQHPSDAREQIQEFTQSSDIAIAFANLQSFGEASRIAWDWLRGVKLTAADARLANLPPVLDQSLHFVRVLQMLGRLAREVEDSMLVLMLDEATKLDNVKDDDALAHWTNSLKLLADDTTRDVGLIISISVTNPNDAAEPLHDPQVMGRFGQDNYIPLNTLNEDKTREFMSDLVLEWVDPELRDELMRKFGVETDGEAMSEKSFPFTEDGLTLAARHAAYIEGAGVTTPRDIQKVLDDLLNRAIDEDRHILSTQYLNPIVNS
jgi:Cdc6-like AAA superfamily ATPase